MKVGDLIKVPMGAVTSLDLKTDIAVLVEKVPRSDVYEYDWLVFIDGRHVQMGRQIEVSAEVLA